MAIETELKLRLPAGGAAALLRHPLLAQQAPHKQRLPSRIVAMSFCEPRS